jgi:hypothetical protein
MKTNHIIINYLIILTLPALSANCANNPLLDENLSATYNITSKARSTESEDYETAAAAVMNMKIGWNLGNTLDCNSNEVNGWIEKYTDQSPKAYETAWGQPQATQALMHKFKEIGFNAIRVPVTWWPHMSSDTLVNAAWMKRVDEVVNYVLNENMYCILNVHHDTGSASSSWLRADMTKYDAINAKYVKLWKQIADHFNKYGDHLIFESYNEILDSASTWNYPNDANAYKAVNQLAQSFVNTVRATGGNNAKRNLVVNTYCAGNGGNWGDCNKVLSNFVIPTDITKNHIAVEVHSYNPYNWDKNHAKWTTSNESDISSMMSRLNNFFVNKGIPVIIGEYGAMNVDTSAADQKEGAKYAASIVSKAKKLGIATFYWMKLMDSKDRSTLKWTSPIIVDAITSSYYGSDALSTGIKDVTQ